MITEKDKAINRAIEFIERNKGLKPEPIRIAKDIINGLIKVKKLNIDDVSKSFTEKQMDDAYDKGYKDGATAENEMH
tara:strand:+ start:391 stop:621 length:231 start_codon:yes stop_codon:yes gene_type:complete